MNSSKNNDSVSCHIITHIDSMMIYIKEKHDGLMKEMMEYVLMPLIRKTE